MVVEREHVALRIEDVVLHAGGRASVVSGARTMHAALRLHDFEGANVEIFLSALERLGVEELGHHSLHVLVKFRQLRLGVSLADDQQVDFLRRRTVLEDAPHLARRLALRRVDEAGARIDERGPDLLKCAVLVALLDDELHRLLRPGEAHRLLDRAGPLLRFVRGHPFTEDRREPARVDCLIRVAIDDLEEVVAEVERVDQAGTAARPQSVRDHRIEGDDFFASVSGVEVIDPHGPIEEQIVKSGGEGVCGDKKENEELAHGADCKLAAMRRAWIVAVCIIFGGLKPAAPQVLQEKIVVERILVDARVTGYTGEPILGLTTADFRVRIDGKPATVESIEWIPESAAARELAGIDAPLPEVN